jgi:hypothetical protein
LPTTGAQVGPTVQLPRPITNCLGTVELGADGLELSAAKFYPRALATNELADIYAGGAPLSEIATSTVLRTTTEDSFAGLQFSTAASAAGTAETLATENARTAASLLVSKRALGENDDVRDAALYLIDESPAAPLFLAPDIASLLPPRELARWIAQGSLKAAVSPATAPNKTSSGVHSTAAAAAASQTTVAVTSQATVASNLMTAGAESLTGTAGNMTSVSSATSTTTATTTATASFMATVTATTTAMVTTATARMTTTAAAGQIGPLVEAWRNETRMGLYWSMWDGALYVENYGQVTIGCA